MALLKRKSSISDAIPTASMADIAFLLLIFFLVSTTFDDEIGLQVVLPELGPQSEQEVSPQNLVFFQVQPDGSIVLRHGDSPAERRITGRQELIDNTEIIAVVQTSPQATYEDMITVLDGIQGAGATRFSLQLLDD
jgi:biopolymer transport protein ExbD